MSPIISGGGGGGGGTPSPVLTATVNITSAQVLTWNTAPTILVAAPGAGKVIVPLTLIASLSADTTPYTFGPSGSFYALGIPTGTFANFFWGCTAGALQTAMGVHSAVKRIIANDWAAGTWSASGDPETASNLENLALILGCANENPTLGDATLKVTASYVIFTT